MVINRSSLLWVISFLIVLSIIGYNDVYADKIKGTSIPFEDSQYLVEDDNDKPFDTSSGEAADEEIERIQGDVLFGLDTEGVVLIRGKAETFVSMLAAIIIALAVIMIVFAGFKISTSEGNSEQLRKAKMQIIASGIGIGIALFTFVIMKGMIEIINVYN